MARLAKTAALGLVSVIVIACAHEEHHPAAAPKPAEAQAVPIPPPPAQYVLADPSNHSSSFVVKLGGGALGVGAASSRVVVGRDEPRFAVEHTTEALKGGARIPFRLGGGFVFWTQSSLYRADAFDGPLKPIAHMPDTIDDVSLAPKAFLVRTSNGERWAIAASGERAPIDPPGVVDVAALDDGRALAFDDQGAAFSSTDGGGHWTDITGQLRAAPDRVAVIEDELYIFEDSPPSGAFRLEADGHLVAFDTQPPVIPDELRPRDPRWRGTRPVLQSVFHGGVALDESTAIVLEAGEIYRVETHTGALLAHVAANLPPDAVCEGLLVPGDALFACASPASGSTTSFLVSHTLADAPVIEHTFTSTGLFFAGDDGGLVFSGACAGAGTPAVSQACVRQADGTWEDVTLDHPDDGGAAPETHAMRWFARADGHVVALVGSQDLSLVDPRAGTEVALPKEAAELFGGGRGSWKRHLGMPGVYGSLDVLDTAWTFTPSGTLRGWKRDGPSVEIAADGQITPSPFVLDAIHSGAFALGKSHEGRFYQTSDHGASWVEVAAPPAGAAGLELEVCTSAGCDLGSFYRVGWAARPPRIEEPQRESPPVPDVKRTPPVMLACSPSGPLVARATPRTVSSPDDLGLGATRVPVSSPDGNVLQLHSLLPRLIVNPAHTAGGGEETALRAMLVGFQTLTDSSQVTVAGPNPSYAALRRPLLYVPPFDPAAPVKKASFAMSEVIASGHALGLTDDELDAGDLTVPDLAFPVTPADPAAPGELALFERGTGPLVHLRAGGRVRVTMHVQSTDVTVLSGVALGADEAAFLELDSSSGVGHVFKVGSGGVNDLYDVGVAQSNVSSYPANPDALAVGPHGDLAVIRTGSGSDPPSTLDPALLLVQGSPASALAPWSTLRFADDPACTASKDAGWRTTLQTIAPWVRMTTADLRVVDAPMFARVRWSRERVCLEGIEVKVPAATMRGAGAGDVSTWLVSRGSTFARVGVADGVEWRQPYVCAIAPSP